MPVIIDLATSLAFCFLLPSFTTYTSDAGEVTDAFWDRSLVQLPQSTNLSVSCRVVGADRFDVIRVIHSYGAKSLLLADNDVMGPIFARLPRYHVTYGYVNNSALITVSINGVHGEDTGILACQQVTNNDVIAYVDVVVYVPVSDVHVTSISSDGVQSAVASGGDVYLQQGTSLGVGCVVTTEGSRIPPAVSVHIGDDDVTTAFNRSVNVSSESLTAGLTFYRIVVRLTYITSSPDRRLHGKRIVCTASRTGFDDVRSTSLLLVQFAPVVTCSTNEYSADFGSNVTMTCNVSANPGSQVTWSAVVQSHDDNFYRITDDGSVSVTSAALSETDSSVSLHIIRVSRRHSRNYTLLASSELGSDSDVVTLHVVAVAPPSVTRSTSSTTSLPPLPTSSSMTSSTTSSTVTSPTAKITRWRRRTTTTRAQQSPDAVDPSCSVRHVSNILFLFVSAFTLFVSWLCT